MTKCRVCGQSLLGKRKGALHCSRHCKTRWRNRPLVNPRNCKRCAASFFPHANAPGLFCSRTCASLNQARKVSVTCHTCAKKLFIKRSIVKNAQFNFCSQKCRRKWMRTTMVQRTCLFCKKTFENSVLGGGAKYCSRLCNGRARQRANVMHLRRLMESAGIPRVCANCSYNEFPEVIQVHHKDENRCNDSLENLQYLCPTCHVVFHYKFKHKITQGTIKPPLIPSE